MTDFVHPERPFPKWIQRFKEKLNSERAPKAPKWKIPDLLALSPQTDPFYAGSGDRLCEAEWFQKVWDRVGAGIGFHLRRIHYALLDVEGFKNVNGLTYQNTEADWDALNSASRQARHLGLVDAGAFADRKNGDPIIPDWTQGASTDPYIVAPELPEFMVPFVTIRPGELEYQDKPDVYGYDKNDFADRAFYVEVWIEKTSQNDILVPLCKELGIGLVPAQGKQSITSAVQFLKRVKRFQRPGRILYVSDLDPAGESMPISVARQLEFYRPIYAPNCQISLNAIALTLEQVLRYKLPRIPLKTSDRGTADFEKRKGEGGCELDALESRKPGELERLIRNAVRQYEDDDLADELKDVRDRTERHVQEKWGQAMHGLQEELSAETAKIKKVSSKYFPKVQALQKQMERELRPHQKRLTKLQEQFARTIEQFNVALEERPTPLVEPEESDWLFDTRRDYMAQLAFYKTAKDRPNEGTGHSKK